MLVVVVSSHAISQPTEFKTDVGQFSVITPSPLKETKVVVETPLGKIDVPLFKATHGNVQYSILYSDLVPSYFHYLQYLPPFSQMYDPEKKLDEYRNRMVKKLDGKIVSETKITLDDNPGREVVIDASEKLGSDAVMKTRAFVAKNRLYQVMVVAPRAELSASSVIQFFDSFKLRTN